MRWWRDLKYVIKHFRYVKRRICSIDFELDGMRINQRRMTEFVEKHFDVHMDIRATKAQPDLIICVGRFKGRDHVQVIPVDSEFFTHTLNIARKEFPFARRGVVDTPPTINTTYFDEG